MIKKVLVLATCMVFLMAGAAQADMVNLHSGGVGVSITDPKTSNVATAAGLFTIDFGTQSSFQTYQGFCVDYETIGWGWNSSPPEFSMIAVPDVTAYREAAYIYNKYASTNGALAQLAVWEVVFEQLSQGNAQTVKNEDGKGVFYVTDNPYSLDLGLANEWVKDALENGRQFDTSSFRLLVSPSSATGGFYGSPYQDFLVRVPEPGVLTLLGLGLVALGITRRRSK